MSDEATSVLIENRTSMGPTVLMYIHDVCRMFGAYGVKIGSNGEIELLLVGPEDSGWVSIEDAPVVQAGTPRTKAKKN